MKCVNCNKETEKGTKMDKKRHCENMKRYQQKQRDAWNRLSKEEQELLCSRIMREIMAK